LEKSHPDEKAKATKNLKKRDTSNEVLEELHLLEVKEAAARRVEKHKIREKELDLAAKKQEFKKEKHKAKVRKMEIEAKKSEQQFELMRLMLSRNTGWSSESQAQQAMAGPSLFGNLLPSESASTSGTKSNQSDWGLDDKGIPQVPVGELSEDLLNWAENNHIHN
jgi:hypothetical protein